MTTNHETYLLMASTQNDMEDWVKTIRRVIWAPFGGGQSPQTFFLTPLNFIVTACFPFSLQHYPPLSTQTCAYPPQTIETIHFSYCLMYNGDKQWDNVMRLLWIVSALRWASFWVDLARYWLNWQTSTMLIMNGRVWMRIGSSDSPLLLSEWTRLRRPLCFQSRRFDIYCSWLLFKRTSHSSKMPEEGGSAHGAEPVFSPGSPRHNHSFQVLQKQQRPTGSWLVRPLASEWDEKFCLENDNHAKRERDRERVRETCVGDPPWSWWVYCVALRILLSPNIGESLVWLEKQF